MKLKSPHNKLLHIIAIIRINMAYNNKIMVKKTESRVLIAGAVEREAEQCDNSDR